MKYSRVPWKLLTGHNAEAKYSGMDFQGSIRKMSTLYEQIAMESGGADAKRKRRRSKIKRDLHV